MQVLFEAIYDYYLTTTLADILTGLYNTEAPQDAVFPYGVFSLVSDVPEGTFTEDFENCLIQFNLFSNAALATEVCNAFESLKTAFDSYDLIVAGYRTVSLTREVANMIKVEKIWQYNVTYRLLIQKET